MRKILSLFVLIALIAVFPVFSQEYEDGGQMQLQLNFMNVSFGAYLPTPGKHMFDFGVEIMKIGMEHRYTGFGIDFTPIRLFTVSGIGPSTYYDYTYDDYYYMDSTDAGFSFVNVSVYFNLIKSLGISSDFFIAPFATLNFLFMDGQEFSFDRYIFTAGLRSGIRGGSRDVKYDIFTIEAGFRYIDGEGKFYFGIKYDAMMHQLGSQGLFY